MASNLYLFKVGISKYVKMTERGFMKKTVQTTFKMISLIILMSVFSFSCAKKKSGIRAVTKTDSRVIRPETSTPSVQAATNQNLKYVLSTLSIPQLNDNGSYSIVSEILNPTNQYVPITTTHLGAQDAYGVYNDSATNAQLDIRSRCIGEQCDKYVLLVTVVKGGYAYHQMAAISYANDCHFNVEHRNAQVVQLYKSLDEVISSNSNVTAQNDCASSDE